MVQVGEPHAVVNARDRRHLQSAVGEVIGQTPVALPGAESAAIVHSDAEPKVVAFEGLRQPARLRVAPKNQHAPETPV